MTDDTNKKVIETIAGVLEIDEAELKPNTDITEFPNWDSMEQANIVIALEQKFDITIANDAIGKLETVQNFIDEIKKYL